MVIQIPFMHSTFYIGPIASWMGGAEVAWLLGLAVSGGLYDLFTSRVRDEVRNRSLAGLGR